MIVSKVSTLMGTQRVKIRQLSREAGISYSAASELYHGTTKAISFEVMDKLCRFFGVEPGELFEWNEEEVSYGR